MKNFFNKTLPRIPTTYSDKTVRGDPRSLAILYRSMPCVRGYGAMLHGKF